MPPSHSPLEIARQISHLQASLAVAKEARTLFTTWLNRVRSQLLTQANDIVRMRNKRILWSQEAQNFLASNRMAEHQQKLRDITNLDAELEGKIVLRDDLEFRLERAAQDVRNNRREIIILENAINVLWTHRR